MHFECFVHLTFSFHLNHTKTQINSFVLFVMCGLWAVMWFCWKCCLGGSIKSLLFTIIWLHIYHQDVTTIELEAQSESLKTYFDEKEDTTLAGIIEKIRKLPKSSMVYFSQVTTLLKISLMLPVTNTFSEWSASTLHRIKNWLRTSMKQGRLNHCMLLATYKEMTDKLSLTDVATNEFCVGSDECSRLFGHFCQNLRFKVTISTNDQGKKWLFSVWFTFGEHYMCYTP